MAAKQTEVAEYLSCPECHELYKKSRYLPCCHSCCEHCLKKLQTESNALSIITCPVCSEEATVSKGGVEDFPDNFFINRLVDEVVIKRKVNGVEDVSCDRCIRWNDPAVTLCMDCGVFLCKHCCESHKYEKISQGHNMRELSELRSTKEEISRQLKQKPVLCLEHDLELSFYCETCEQVVCHYCTIKEHNKHVYNTMKKMAEKHRLQLDEIMKPVQKMIERLSEACHEITATQEEIKKQAIEVDQHIETCYEKLLERLQQQRDKLKSELKETSMHKEEALSKQIEQIKCVLTQFQCVNGLYSVMKDRANQESLFSKKQVIKDINRITNHYNRLNTKPVESATTEFVPFTEPKFEEMLGQVHVSGFEISNAPCYGFVERAIEFNIANKYKMYLNNLDIRVLVNSIATGDVIQAQVDRNKDGSYSVSFVCNEVGETILTATVEGHTITGSPHNITIHRDYKFLAHPSKIINNSGKMGVPWGISFGNNGLWAAAIYDRDCVHVFDSQDQLLRTFGSSGNGNGEFSWPYGLAFDVKNDLYVSDYNNNRIQKFTVNGEYVCKFGTRGVLSGQIINPLSILVYNNEVFVADQDNHRISVFHLDGRFNRIIGSKQQLNKPHDMAASVDNQLFVANFNNNCISVYKLDDGQYVRKFGTPGTGIGQLGTPTSLTIDRYDFILVTEYLNNRVSVFDSSGSLVHCFGSAGGGLGQFRFPRSIAISPRGNIYVSDYDNQRIQFFSSF